eukprot:TRINITY_DN2747_c0_g2_i3.p1 TRINITY_DN2747_c0_g2~~TRINITY_DN2747_c0_g2_i3.p1  ORF type:complete len:266 (-),score=27.84 TRINITY_DN2747_c0_g2_i3:207-1004(-)
MQGVSSSGEITYNSREDFWYRQQDEQGKGYSHWYQRSVQYWDRQEATNDGVLGGYGHVNTPDISDSRALLKRILWPQIQEGLKGVRQLTAIDCGAGIGRVAQQLLLPFFQEVDLLEPSQHLIDNAKKNLTTQSIHFPQGHSAGKFLCQGLQDFRPEFRRYDCIWIQWCLLYLTDEDIIQLLLRCIKGLKEPDEDNGYGGGIVVVKENICSQGFIQDDEDSSLTRSAEYMRELFAKGGMRVVSDVKQKNFPKELYQVRMYVLRPAI